MSEVQKRAALTKSMTSSSLCNFIANQQKEFGFLTHGYSVPRWLLLRIRKRIEILWFSLQSFILSSLLSPTPLPLCLWYPQSSWGLFMFSPPEMKSGFLLGKGILAWLHVGRRWPGGTLSCNICVLIIFHSPYCEGGIHPRVLGMAEEYTLDIGQVRVIAVY